MQSNTTCKLISVRTLELTNLVNVYLLISIKKLHQKTTEKCILSHQPYTAMNLCCSMLYSFTSGLYASALKHVIKSEAINNVISVYILQNQFGCLKCHPQL